MKTFNKTLFLIFLFSNFLIGCDSSNNTKKIGIVVPLEHKAMTEIVHGFSETLAKEYKHDFKINVLNAQGDLTIQRAILQQMKNSNYDLIVPIGTSPTQMAVATIKQQPIVSLAATYSDKERKQEKSCHAVVVHDEISPEEIIAFIHETYPNLSQLTLIHSASDKIFPDVRIATLAAQKVGIKIKSFMISSLSELRSVAAAAPNDTQAFLILKDNLIVSGINTIAFVAEKKHIPLITADQGSVQDGAAFALGVHEKEIGMAGAQLAAQILNGKEACALPNVSMKNLTVFVNKETLAREGQSLKVIEQSAKKRNYPIEFVNTGENKT